LPSRIEHQPSNGYLLPAALVTVKTADCIDARFGVHSALLPFTAPLDVGAMPIFAMGFHALL